MSEHEPSQDEQYIDPRSQLFEALHDFFVRAITEQSSTDEYDQSRQHTRSQPGSLYKIDDGYLKVLLQAPAADVVMSRTGVAHTPGQDNLPLLWLQTPLPQDNDSVEAILDALFGAERIFMHLQRPSTLETEIGYEVTVDSFQCLDPDVALLTAVPPETDDTDSVLEQQLQADRWVTYLRRYALRTIVNTGDSAA